MKQALTFLVAILTTLSLRAQAPINDAFDCATMVNLGEVPACQPTVYTNTNATPSVIATLDTVSCFQSATATHDVWFRFQCPISLLDLRVTITGTGAMPISNPEFAIYRGDCFFDGLAELDCASAGLGQISTTLDLFGLTPGLDYYIRVSDWSATATPNWGDFTVCVDSIPPIVNITQGSSSLCVGTLYDSGGEFGDYGPNEDHTFVICPDQQSECISFTLEYFNLEPSDPFFAGDGDQLSFFDGNSTNAPLLAALDGTGFTQANIAGGGGVCFNVQATSGCITVLFESDGTVQQEGWKGTWQCNSDPCEPVTVMTVDTTNITGDSIVAAISTGGAMVTVTDIQCNPVQYGIFSFATESNDLNMEKGLLLTSGTATNALGPNNQGGLGTNLAPFNDPGDADLNYLSTTFGNGSLSHDACIIELDVFAATNEVVFEYVFGSEEYPEYIFSSGGFNDIFAFLVSGPGIAGDPNLTNSALNIAVLPNSTTPVQIDSVNNQVNWQYYRNNELSQIIQYDGLTSDFMGVKKSLTARVPVTPCNTYHLKLAIADRGDESFDSGVFVSDIKAGSPDVAIQFASGVDYFIESCTGDDDTLFIRLSKVPTVATTFNISLGGSATIGLDYLLNIPPSITFQPGQTTLAFPIVPLADVLAEGTETILINISRNYGCGEVVLKTLVAEIKDGVEVVVSGGDTLNVCKGDFVQLQASGADTYLWQPTAAVSNAYIANPVTSPTASLWLSVLGAVGSCEDVDSVFIHVIAPGIVVTALSPTSICLGGSVELQAVVDPPGTPVTWSPAVGLDDPNSLNPTATPTFPITYTATITVDGCTVSDFVTVDVDTLHFPDLIADTVLCQNYPVQLAAPLNTTTQYTWTPGDGLDNPNSAGPIATPDETTTYTLVATSQNGACSQTGSVTITIISADIEIVGEDLRLLCLGESDTLTATVSPPGSITTWTPSFYLNTSTGPTVISTPDESITYTATYSVVSGNRTCVVSDSVRLKVDSLPDQAIRRFMDKEVYCQGDTIYLLSNTYEPANFPGIEHSWLPHGLFLTPDDLWNLVIIANDTFTYQRITSIGGCLDTADIFVPVFIPPTLTAVATPPIICPGASSQILVTVTPENPDYEYIWDPMSATSLSCSDCLDPVATPLQTTLYQLSVKDLPCPAGTSVAVFVEQLPVLELAENPVICSTGSVILNNSNQSDVTYTWTPATFLDDPTSANPVSSATQTITYHVVAQGPNCSSEGDVTVKYFNASVNAGSDQIICEAANATLTATTSGDPGTLVWFPTNETTNSITVSPTALQNYTVTLQYGEGCSALDEVTVDVIPLPALNFNPNTTICLGESIPLTLPPSGPGTYQWSPATGLNNPNIPNPIATPTGNITYSVTATNQNCTVQGSISISVASANVSVGPDQNLCFGESITLTATVTGTPADSIIWMPGHRIGSSIEVSPVITSTYTATIYYGINCTDADAITINVFPPIVFDVIQAVPDPADSICEGVTVKLRVELTSSNLESLQWMANGVPIAGATKDSVEVTPLGSTVTYTVVATDANGCTAESDPVVYNTKRCFEIPNAFTPNGDSANDTFGPVLLGGSATVTRFLIFNRWGQKVFEATPNNKAWDGRTDDKLAPSDVYVYLMVVRFGNGEEEEYHGDVTLLR
ncbi:MAG: choice-of-anchor L domain-containing protein [Saprospiraceae bacterium]|nr:choice-of-anchor L domain-containing protein [Saprospiraceae bacterium]